MDKKRIDYFLKKYPEYKKFLYLVSVPKVFSVDLLYQIYNNFKFQIGEDVRYIVVSDLITSSLCDQVGYKTFKLKDGVRDILGKEAKKEVGNLKVEVARLLEQYVKYKGREMNLTVREKHQEVIDLYLSRENKIKSLLND